MNIVPPLMTFVGLTVAVSLTACSKKPTEAPPPSPTFTLETKMTGYSKPALLACAGPPAETHEVSGHEYLTYRNETEVGGGLLQDTPRIPVIGSLAIGPHSHNVVCEITFILKSNSVEAVTLRADPSQDSKRTAAFCAPMVERCPALH